MITRIHSHCATFCAIISNTAMPCPVVSGQKFAPKPLITSQGMFVPSSPPPNARGSARLSLKAHARVPYVHKHDQ
jgi:hypothetical protein